MQLMRRAPPSRSRLLAPLAQLAALILLAEAWTWQVGGRFAAAIATWPPLRWLEARIRALGRAERFRAARPAVAAR